MLQAGDIPGGTVVIARALLHSCDAGTNKYKGLILSRDNIFWQAPQSS